MSPIYIYRCKGGHKFEKKRKIADMDKGINCPKCRRPVQRQVTSFSRYIIDKQPIIERRDQP